MLVLHAAPRRRARFGLPRRSGGGSARLQASRIRIASALITAVGREQTMVAAALRMQLMTARVTASGWYGSAESSGLVMSVSHMRQK